MQRVCRAMRTGSCAFWRFGTGAVALYVSTLNNSASFRNAPKFCANRVKRMCPACRNSRSTVAIAITRKID